MKLKQRHEGSADHPLLDTVSLPCGCSKVSTAFKHRTFEMLSKKLPTCLDRVDSQGWLGVVWVLAGLIELRLRHLGRFDFHKANIRLWIPSTQVGLGFRSSRVKLMEYCHVQDFHRKKGA